MSAQSHDIPLSEIPGYPAVADIVAGRPLYHFGNVASFYFRRHENELGEVWPDIDLVMQEQQTPHRKIGFRFHRVDQIQFSGWGSIIGLYFQSIKDRGWEHVRFEVGDYENGGIHLFCYEISLYNPEQATDQKA